MHLGGIAHLVIDSTELKVSVKVSGKSKIWQRTASYLVEAPSGSWQQHTWNHPRRPVAKQRDWLRGIPQVNPTAPPEYQVAAADGAYAPPPVYVMKDYVVRKSVLLSLCEKEQITGPLNT